MLNVYEIFASIAGEAGLSGIPAVFIRLGGCNLKCNWCDSQEACSGGTKMSLKQILDAALKFRLKWVVITGGEPLMQEETPALIADLINNGITNVALETNGTYDISCVDYRTKVMIDVKCPSSGESHKSLLSNLSKLKINDEVKFVIKDRSDFDYAKEIIDKYLRYSPADLYFTTVFGESDPKMLVQWLQEELPSARFYLQIHKLIGVK